MEQGNPSHGHRAQGVAVIGLGQLQEALLLGPLPLPPVLEGDFQGRFHAGGAVIGEEHLGEAGRGDFCQAAGQHDGRWMGQAQEGAVSQALQLVPDSPVQLRAPMPVNVTPQGGHPVQVAAALIVKQINPLPPGHDEEFLFPEVLHLGKGMPEMVVIPADQGFVIVAHQASPLPQMEESFPVL